MATSAPLRVMEFYAGAGGFHWALNVAGINAEIVASIDINTNTSSVYVHNFPITPHVNRNICGMTAKEVDGYRPDVFVLSPPCQPFTRQGLRRDNQDHRTDSFFHLMTILGETKCPPSYLLMEKVQGFETSQTRQHFVGLLHGLGYNVQEFLLSPNQFGIPNSRLRYYLLAKRKPLQFITDVHVGSKGSITSTDDDSGSKPIPSGPCTDVQRLLKFVPRSDRTVLLDDSGGTKMSTNSSSSNPSACCSEISSHLQTLSDDELSLYLVPDKVLQKYAIAMDIVRSSSNHSCCFTKAYGNYALGTGSVLQHSLKSEDLDKAFEQYGKLQSEGKMEESIQSLKKLNLRYFTPKEVANLMCFPSEFSFPPSLSTNQCYKVMGNSLNVLVVASLMGYLFCDNSV